MNYGYCRVSSIDQNAERQLVEMRKLEIADKNIFLDKQSGKDFERTNWKRLCRRLKEGDTLFVKSIDRLGRNYEDILFVWRHLTKDKKVHIVVLDMPLLDTRNERDLMGTVISDIVLQLLSYVAQTEREFIKQRQAEGIAAAKARGVRFGRPLMERPAGYEKAFAEWQSGECSARQAGQFLGVEHRTFLRWAKADAAKKEIET